VGYAGALAGALVVVSCPSPQTRPGPAYDGSAYWAWALAQPLVTSFAADAKLYRILGSTIMPDGRLPSNTGAWSFVVWSASHQQEFQVTVSADGHTSTSTTQSSGQTINGGLPVPVGWANSLIVFQAAAPHLAAGVTHSQLAVLNMASYPQAPGQVVWGINYNVGSNQLVRWDGTYIGAQ
jgi:hypothetical protein